ncbi:hypothetical protein MNBD_GAMMA19-470 [hydrothermal vent metagenome]|uniref:Toxin n=1 Tax=hydrothermal vent metagenome TaxID=652676 RepID=A0A3B1AKB6_9ZZZZ
MANYKLTKKAERDLEDIIDYTLQQWGTLQAKTYLDQLETHAQLLANNPDAGVERENISENLLSFPYKNHILYYLKQNHGITIVRVLHERMDPIKHL